MIDRLQSMIRIVLDPQAIRGLLSWPVFSVAAYSLVSSLKRQGIIPRTVIDVGANIGQFTIAAAKLFPGASIHCFEPLPECQAALQKTIAGLSGVDLHPCALGETTGEVEFHVNTHLHSSSILQLADSHRQAFPGAQVTRSITVPLTTLDEELKSTDLKRPCLLKIDVQGFEPQVISGAATILRDMDFVVLESSLKPMYEGEMLFIEMLDFMQSRGFRFLRPVGSLADPRTGEILQIDALFGRV